MTNELDIWLQIDSDTSATSTLGQWYDLYLRMDGSSVEVWRALTGQTKTRVLGTTQAGIVSSARFDLQEASGYYAQVDDVVMTVPDPVTTSYQYNNANEMITMTTSGVNTTFTYDAWGRLVTKNQGSYQARYGYRFGDKLKDVASNFPGEAATIYYQYDGLGKRRNKTLDLVNTTWWRWDLGWNAIQEYADPDSDWDIENLALTYIPGMAEVPGTNPATGSYRYYMGDHLGSVRTMRDQNKAALASYEYMPYGEAYNQTGLALNKGFTGHTWDKDDGLYYAPYRYYSPVASRWLTRDPLGMVDGPNVYIYVKNNPLNEIDILGLFSWECFKKEGKICPWGWTTRGSGCDAMCCRALKEDPCDKCWATYKKDVAKCIIKKDPLCPKKAESKLTACLIRNDCPGMPS